MVDCGEVVEFILLVFPIDGLGYRGHGSSQVVIIDLLLLHMRPDMQMQLLHSEVVECKLSKH